MRVGLVGLGRMGFGMAERLRRSGHAVESFDPKVESTAGSLQELVARLDPPRVVWLMVPAGEATEQSVATLLALLDPGDILVDGGNSSFRDSLRRAKQAGERGVGFLDVGVSGGTWGLAEGYCLMVGGSREAAEQLRPLFQALAPADGFAHVGPAGAGHFVKMVHNGVEYGLMQAYAEGFELLRETDLYELDLAAIAQLWRHGSVVRGWLLDLLASALAQDPDLAAVRGYVEDSGEGRWTVQEALEAAVPLPAIALALFARFASRQEESFAAKVNAALREQFGGHPVRRT